MTAKNHPSRRDKSVSHRDGVPNGRKNSRRKSFVFSIFSSQILLCLCFFIAFPFCSILHTFRWRLVIIIPNSFEFPHKNHAMMAVIRILDTITLKQSSRHMIVMPMFNMLANKFYIFSAYLQPKNKCCKVS